MIHALVFDFDGLILDTETPRYRAWQEVFADHALELPIEAWHECIGRAHDFVDFYDRLEEQFGRPVDREAIRAKRRPRLEALVAAQQVCGGVEQYVADARRLGLKLAVASGSDRAWVTGHLRRLGLLEPFGCIKCVEDTAQHKPDPAPFLAVLAEMGVEPSASIALEDSPNGIASAKAAGMYCLAVPNPLTRGLDLSAADWITDSLADLPLGDLLRRIDSA